MSAAVLSQRPQLLKRSLLAVAALLLLALLSVGGIYGYWVTIEHRLSAITPGHVYQSAQMPPQEMVRVARRLGIQTVFDFRGDGGGEGLLTAAEQQALEQAGIKYVHIPSAIRPAPATVAAFLAAMKPEQDAHRTVLLHCKDGEGRSVFYAAIYRIQFEGWSNEQAYQATARLPPALMFLHRMFPSLGRLSAQNAKTPLILAYRRAPPEAATAAP
jgi:uncharacterized protein (TIGR01244 family)